MHTFKNRLRAALPGPALSAIRALRRLLTRLANDVVAPATYPWRHARAFRRLERFEEGAVLFVCYGNICRSPYAEMRMRVKPIVREVRLSISSAGLYGRGRPSPDRAQAVARRHGVDLAGHRSRSLSEVSLDRTLVVVMEGWQAKAIRRQARIPRDRLLVLGDLDPIHHGSPTIPDPYGFDEGVFDACFTRIDRCIEVLVARLSLRPDGRVGSE